MLRYRLRPLAAAVRGQRHVQDGTPCQDAATIHVFSRGEAAVWVSDGTGSARWAEEGSHLAVNVAAPVISKEFDAYWANPALAIQPVLDSILCAIRNRAQTMAAQAQDLSCTVLFVHARITRGGRVRYVAGNLGDGAIMQRNGVKTSVLLGPLRGEYANATWSVTSTDAAARFQITSGELPGSAGFLLATDGALFSLVGERTGDIAGVVLSLLEDARIRKFKAAQVLLERFVRTKLVPRTHDDCTVGLLQARHLGNELPKRLIA